MDTKHKSIDDFKRKNDLYKLLQIKKQQEQREIKEDELFKFFRKKEENENRNNFEVQCKHENVEIKRKLKEAEMRKTMQEKIINNLKKEEFVCKQRSQLDMFKEAYDNKLKEKMDKINERVFNRKEQLYKEMINKYDNLQIRREDNLEKYFSNEKAHEWEREKRFEIIMKKMQRIEDIK